MRVALHDTDFFLRLEKMLAPRSLFEEQGEAHGEIDLRLVQAIEHLLVPELGRWEQSGTWFHQLDFYGDGVRSLTFARSEFPFAQVRALQQLLRGEHAQFCILCIATDRMAGPDDSTSVEREDDYVAIFADELLATTAVAARLDESEGPF